jgi:RNA polymerase sigma-70 factor (ECF subfamily)
MVYGKIDIMTVPIVSTSLPEDFQKPNEADLIAAAKKDPKEFGRIYHLYIQSIFRYLYSRIGSLPDAEDATAQTFLAALEALDRYQHHGHLAAWLFAIARRKAMDHFRRQRRQVPLENAENISSETDLLHEVIQTEEITSLATLINALSEEEHELIRLRYIAELSFSEIGQLLHRNEAAVKKSLYRLLARLQSQLDITHE